MENGHFGLNGEEEALAIAHPSTLGVDPAGGGVCTKHIPLGVLHHEDGGALVAHPARNFRQALVMLFGRVEEAPVLPVLQEQVGVDEEDAGEGSQRCGDEVDWLPGVVQAAAVLCEVGGSGNNRSWVILIRHVIILCVKDVVKDVFLHLANLWVTINPSLRH